MHLIVVLTLVTLAATDVYDSSYVYGTFRSKRTGQSVSNQCINYQQYQYRKLNEINYKITFWDGDSIESATMCQPGQEVKTGLNGSIVPVDYRYAYHETLQTCTEPAPSTIYDVAQLKRAENYDTSAMLYLMARGYLPPNSQYHDYLFADFRDTDFDLNETSETPIYFIYNDVFTTIMNQLVVDPDDEIELIVSRPDTYPVDPAMLIIFILAVFSIFVGGYWSGRQRWQLHIEEIETEARRQRRRERRAAKLAAKAARAAQLQSVESESSTNLVANDEIEKGSRDNLTVDAAASPVSGTGYYTPAQSPQPVTTNHVRIDIDANTEHRVPSSASENGDLSPKVHKKENNNKSKKLIVRQKETSSTPFNWITLAVMVSSIVLVLILAYLYRNVMVWLFIVLFVIGSAAAMYTCLTALFQTPVRMLNADVKLPLSFDDVTDFCCKRRIGYHEPPTVFNFIVALLSFSTAIVWCVYRNEYWAFSLQDFLSLCFCINVIRQLRIPSLKSITVLLVILLIYDLVMVFLTPFITPDGCSIMVQVATGGSCHLPVNGAPVPPCDVDLPENIPILFRVPRLSDPMISCYNMTIEVEYKPMILGMGDVILPGLLVGFCYGADKMLKLQYHVYGVTSSIAFALGLIITFIALIGMNMAQPALIYLVPSTLIPVIILSLVRKEFKRLWKGNLNDEQVDINKLVFKRSSHSERETTCNEREQQPTVTQPRTQQSYGTVERPNNLQINENN